MLIVGIVSSFGCEVYTITQRPAVGYLRLELQSVIPSLAGHLPPFLHLGCLVYGQVVVVHPSPDALMADAASLLDGPLMLPGLLLRKPNKLCHAARWKSQQGTALRPTPRSANRFILDETMLGILENCAKTISKTFHPPYGFKLCPDYSTFPFNRFKYVETIKWKLYNTSYKQNISRFTPHGNRFMSLEDAILNFLKRHSNARREEIRRGLESVVGEATVWRHLKALRAARKVEVEGRGPATRYRLSGAASVRAHLTTPWNERPIVRHRKSFLDAYIPNKTFYLNEADQQALRKAGTPNMPSMAAGTYAKRILERLLVDLSWASSRMEGNTYNILDTERLIRFGEAAKGKERKEAVMILNHKDAIQYVVENIMDITISRQDIFNLHTLLSTGLLTNPAMAGRLREMAVDITHTPYKPLDDKFDIEAEFGVLIDKASEILNPFEQSFFVLLHIPYLQPFDDVNKRAGRIAANAPLLKADLAPLSFVAMNDRDYIDGLLGVYELNNVALLREAYIAAYRASADNYKTLRAEVESPEKAALAYRDFVKDTIRQCVLEWQTCPSDTLLRLAKDAGIPQDEQQAVVNYILAEFAGLHEGNCIRYRLKPEDLEQLSRPKAQS